MTLEDKFRQELQGQLSDEKTEVDVRIATSIAEDFALGFIIFISSGFFQKPGEPARYIKNRDSPRTGKTFSIIRLLEMYKDKYYN